MPARMSFNPRRSPADDAWRTTNAGRRLAAAADAFVRDKLRVVAEGGFPEVAQVHMALVQNLDRTGTRLTRIAARARMTKQGMLELVDKAEALGFVERRQDPADRRAKTVAFTPAGLRMLARLRDGVALAERRMEGAVGAGFLAEMKDALAAYVADEAGEDVPMPGGEDVAWRMHNAGRVLVSAFGVFSRDVAAGLRMAGFGAVSEVHLTLVRHFDAGGTRLTALAARARMTKQAMAELVDKTASLGLVVRAPDPADRRAKAITFTPLGLRMLEEVRRSVDAAEHRLAAVTGHRLLDEMKLRLGAYAAAMEETCTVRVRELQ